MLTNRYIMERAKAMKRRVGCGSIQREGHTVWALYAEPFEDHLQAALIRHGDSVIVTHERLSDDIDGKKGGTANYSSLSAVMRRGIFYFTGNCVLWNKSLRHDAQLAEKKPARARNKSCAAEVVARGVYEAHFCSYSCFMKIFPLFLYAYYKHIICRYAMRFWRWIIPI